MFQKPLLKSVFSKKSIEFPILEREGLIFGKKEYERYWEKPGTVPPISYLRAYTYYESLCPLSLGTGKKVKETQKLVLFSEEILQNLDHVGELAKSPKPGGIPGCFYKGTWRKAFEVHGKSPLGRSFWAFVTVTVLEGSLGKTADQLLAIQYPGYRIHKAVERSFFNFSVHVKTGKYPDGQERSIYTICQERVELPRGRFTHLTVGGACTPAALSVDVICLVLNIGVALLREF